MCAIWVCNLIANGTLDCQHCEKLLLSDKKYWANSATSDRRIMQDTCSRTSDITFRLWKCSSLWSPTDGAATSTKGTELCCSPHYPYKETRTHHTRVAAFTLTACSFATNLQSAFVYLLCIKWSGAGPPG